MNGIEIRWDTRDPLGLTRARRQAADFRADSVRQLRVAPTLRALSWDELYAAIRAGAARIAGDTLMPAVAGAGGEELFCAIPNTTNAPVTVATATSRKTLIQVATPSTTVADIVQWSCSFDASAAAQPIVLDLTEVDVAATVTSLTPTKYTDPGGPASLCVGGTAATGYNASAEGTIGSSRIFDSITIPPTQGLLVQYPLSREPKVAVSKFLRLRALGFTSDTPNAIASILWRE